MRSGVPLLLEILGGVLIAKASPSFEHADAQLALGSLLRGRFHRRGGGGRGEPAGWWIVTECDVELEKHEVFRPDICGWRRDRVPQRPAGRPIQIIPGWVCEVLSPSNAANDLHHKLQVLWRCHVDHYWIVDPEHQILTGHRWSDAGYVVALAVGREETVRAEPFQALELRVGALFGIEEEEPAVAG